MSRLSNDALPLLDIFCNGALINTPAYLIIVLSSSVFELEGARFFLYLTWFFIGYRVSCFLKVFSYELYILPRLLSLSEECFSLLSHLLD